MTAPDRRPDPDQLLEQIKREEARRGRGRLKIFLGAAPGVGKTYAMLEAARVRYADGGDVVVGLVETHGRAETSALLEGIPVLARRAVEYRGTKLTEFDLAAALERRPALVLVDELAHTNAPGSRHLKRWQDVEELLARGIDVYTTLNVQHIESLKDVVGQITKVTVRETVPDAVLEDADEIELVDVTPEVLLQRLKEGKVYVPERAKHAIEQFFRKGNLIALRELSLRRAAEQVDAQMRGYMVREGIRDTWPAGDRILVCVGPNPTTARLIRAGKRMAAGLKADWMAVYVEQPGHERLPRDERDAIAENLRLAESLGARTVTLSGERAAEEILAYARAQNVTRIICGKPTHARWRDKIFGSFLDQIVRGSGAIDVYVITGESLVATPHPARAPAKRSPWREYWRAVLFVALATGVNFVLRSRLSATDEVMVYLLAIVVVSTRYGRGPATTSTLLSIALFDFMFVTPYYTFAVSDVAYVLTFGVMLVIALVMSRLAARIRRQAEAARAREQRTAALYAMTRELATTSDVTELVTAAVKHIRGTFGGDVRFVLPDESGRLAAVDVGPAISDGSVNREAAEWVYMHGERAGLGSDTFGSEPATYLPLGASDRTVGILVVRPAERARLEDPTQRQLLETFASQAAGAIERARLARRHQHALVEMEGEKLRNSLLSSLSHDLRTPLAGIEGAASALVADSGNLTEDQRRELRTTVLEESQRMTRLVGNLLDMIRVESGALQVQREWQPLEEVVGVALIRLEEHLKEHPVSVQLPADLPLVPIDGLLVEQVLINLLDNAAKYTPAGTPIEISAAADRAEVTVAVADRGPGFPEGEEERIFEKFQRFPSSSAGTGVGLGLTICRGIVIAHGGRIWAERRPGGGSIFRFTLPLVGTPPVLEPEKLDGIG